MADVVRVEDVLCELLTKFGSFIDEQFPDANVSGHVATMLEWDMIYLETWIKQNVLPEKVNLQRHDSMAVENILEKVTSADGCGSIQLASLSDENYVKVFDFLESFCELYAEE